MERRAIIKKGTLGELITPSEQTEAKGSHEPASSFLRSSLGEIREDSEESVLVSPSSSRNRCPESDELNP